jgi:hypothetical protein
MPVPVSISELAVSAGSNSPLGTEAVFPNLDNYLRAHAAFIAQLRDSSLSKTAGGTVTGAVIFSSTATFGSTTAHTGAATFASTLAVTGNVTMGGTLAVTGAVTAASPSVSDDSTRLATTAFVRDIVPAGIIAMWSGLVANIPSGWVLCNGSNGTPDLRDRFIVGAGSTYSPGATGGSTAASTTSSNGAHTHTGTTGGHELTVAEMPAHTHTYRGATITGGGSDPDGSGTTFETGDTSSAGSGDAHTHTISSDGAHTHTVTTPLPPFYALCFIQKT